MADKRLAWLISIVPKEPRWGKNDSTFETGDWMNQRLIKNTVKEILFAADPEHITNRQWQKAEFPILSLNVKLAAASVWQAGWDMQTSAWNFVVGVVLTAGAASVINNTWEMLMKIACWCNPASPTYFCCACQVVQAHKEDLMSPPFCMMANWEQFSRIVWNLMCSLMIKMEGFERSILHLSLLCITAVIMTADVISALSGVWFESAVRWKTQLLFTMMPILRHLLLQLLKTKTKFANV